MRRSKKTANEHPWYKYYKEAGYPEHIDYPDCALVDMVMKSAEQWPENVAYIYYGHKVTYRNFMKKIEKAAKALKNYGVKEGDMVTICMPNTPEGITMMYAVNMVGAVCNMVHPLSSEKELEYYITNTESRYVLVIDAVFDKIYRLRDTAKLERIIVVRPSDGLGFLKKKMYRLMHIRDVRLPQDDNRVVLWEDFIANSYFYQGNYHEERHGDDLAAILYSGGTTGTPKGVMLSNRNFNALALQALAFIKEAQPGKGVLSVLPIFHGFGLGVCVHTPLCNGCYCILVPAFSQKQFPDLIRKTQPTVICGVPTLYEALISLKLGPNELSCLEANICGGDALNKTLRAKVNDYLEAHGSSSKIRVGYGLTESTAATCVSSNHTAIDGMIGAPLPDMDFKIVSPDTLEEMPTGKEGEICINGPTNMMGYYRNEEETAKTLRLHPDGKIWLHTGDLGYMDKDGFVYFAQRLKRMIISSGYNIYPTQLEAVINSHEAVLTSTVIGIDHHRKGQVPKAFVVLKEGYKPGKRIERQLRELLERNVPLYAQPVAYEFRDELPKTLVGKVAFKKLEEEEKAKKHLKKA